MEIETLEADYFRGQAHLCHKLADTARATKPLFIRLVFLAQAYEEKAKTADLAGQCAAYLGHQPTPKFLANLMSIHV
jgi:hypothetical protein